MHRQYDGNSGGNYIGVDTTSGTLEYALAILGSGRPFDPARSYVVDRHGNGRHWPEPYPDFLKRRRGFDALDAEFLRAYSTLLQLAPLVAQLWATYGNSRFNAAHCISRGTICRPACFVET